MTGLCRGLRYGDLGRPDAYTLGDRQAGHRQGYENYSEDPNYAHPGQGFLAEDAIDRVGRYARAQQAKGDPG